MKNIHVIPTDKPSRLHFDTKLFLSPNYQDSKTINSIVEGRNIYITNDEEIKIGDWYLNGVIPTNERINKSRGTNVASFYKSKDVRKIILTTDQDLIKDGVQAIDDEFLEWFVAHPSCEGVKVDLVSVNEFGSEITVNGYGFDKFIYKIIIPKEEPKQETHICKYCNAETTQSDDECYAKPKQETLEEAAEKYKYHPKGGFCFIQGAKWQQEQDKNKYSEEEVRRIAEWSFDFHKTNDYSDSELADEWELRLEKMFKNQKT